MLHCFCSLPRSTRSYAHTLSRSYALTLIRSHAQTLLARSPRLQRALDFGFGVNEEVGAGDNAFAVGQPGLDFVHVAVLPAKFDESRLQFAVAFIHKSDVALAG